MYLGVILQFPKVVTWSCVATPCRGLEPIWNQPTALQAMKR
jgi:hypothetical protein